MRDSLFFRNKHYAKGTVAKIRYCNQIFIATYKGKMNATYSFILDNGKEVWIKYKDILSIEVCKEYILTQVTPRDIDINRLVIGWIWYILIMLTLTIFNGRIAGWIVVSIIFFRWRKKAKEEESYYK